MPLTQHYEVDVELTIVVREAGTPGRLLHRVTTTAFTKGNSATHGVSKLISDAVEKTRADSEVYGGTLAQREEQRLR